MTNTLPHWDLTNVYPGLDSPEFQAAVLNYREQIEALEQFFNQRIQTAGPDSPVTELSEILAEAINRFNGAYLLMTTIGPYINSFISTDSYNTNARKKRSELEQISVRMEKLNSRFFTWVGSLAPVLDQVISSNPTVEAHEFTVREAARQSKYLMTPELEALAAELNLSGGRGWAKLQATITSQLPVEFEMDGQMKRIPITALINLRSHPEESVRRRAYETEMKAWGTVLEPLAASLNGIKGTVNTLNQRRGREDALHQAIDDARIDRPTLEAMLGAMKDSLPTFRKYFRAKARRMGKEMLAFYDLFAPMGAMDKYYSWDEARAFIVANFQKFTPDLAQFAQRAFDEKWIDAEPRDGKVPGAFCMGVARVKESRILCNFDGSLDQVSTIAHELGHGYHNQCAYAAAKTPLQKFTPMTLAETASILCETIVMQAVLSEVQDPQEELAILETMLINDSQVIVDIYSRYLFEKEVFERRASSELSAADFSDIMERAQKAAYGDGLDERYLNKYMWTWKSHYYSTGLSFYNFPYAFGLLFGIGLYAIYQQRGDEFVPDYQKLLASTGESNAADLAARFGINIREKKFWEDSLAIIAQRIERYLQI